MRAIINAILIFIGEQVLSDIEFASIKLNENYNDFELYNALFDLLTKRYASNESFEKLYNYFLLLGATFNRRINVTVSKKDIETYVIPGPQGEQGPPGIPGADGPQGETGPSGAIANVKFIDDDYDLKATDQVIIIRDTTKDIIINLTTRQKQLFSFINESDYKATLLTVTDDLFYEEDESFELTNIYESVQIILKEGWHVLNRFIP